MGARSLIRPSTILTHGAVPRLDIPQYSSYALCGRACPGDCCARCTQSPLMCLVEQVGTPQLAGALEVLVLAQCGLDLVGAVLGDELADTR